MKINPVVLSEYRRTRASLDYPAKWALHYAKQWAEILKLEADPEIRIEIIAEPDDICVRGNAMASGNDRLDKQIEDENLEQIRQRYPGAERVNIDEFCKAKALRQDSPIVWTETTKERYWEMLEVLPPAAMGNGGFLAGEPCDHHATTGQPRFVGYREWRGRYWEAGRPMTRKEFNAEMERGQR